MHYYEIVGKYYGYPECCTKDFMSRDLAPEEERQLCGTGYIPCEECNKKSVMDLLLTINRNRVHFKPFPEGDTPGELLNFFSDIADWDELEEG